MTPRCSWDTWLLISAEPINIAHIKMNLKPDAPELATHIRLLDNLPLLIVTLAVPDLHETDLHPLVPLVAHRSLGDTSDPGPIPYYPGVSPNEGLIPLGRTAVRVVIITD